MSGYPEMPLWAEERIRDITSEVRAASPLGGTVNGEFTQELRLPDPCEMCEFGLIVVSACTCGGSSSHEPGCGFRYCPGGCWERLHPGMS